VETTRRERAQAHANALVPQLETGKINCVRLPRCGRLPPGRQMITLFSDKLFTYAARRLFGSDD
jgi:hypothetical protein